MTPAQCCIEWLKGVLSSGEAITTVQHARIVDVLSEASDEDGAVIRGLVDAARVVLWELYGACVAPLPAPTSPGEQASPAERLVEDLWDAIEQGQSEHMLGFTLRQISTITRAADPSTRSYINALRALIAQAQERAAA